MVIKVDIRPTFSLVVESICIALSFQQKNIPVLSEIE